MQITAGCKFIVKSIIPKNIIKVRKQSNFPIDDTFSTAIPRSFRIKWKRDKKKEKWQLSWLWKQEIQIGQEKLWNIEWDKVKKTISRSLPYIY